MKKWQREVRMLYTLRKGGEMGMLIAWFEKFMLECMCSDIFVCPINMYKYMQIKRNQKRIIVEHSLIHVLIMVVSLHGISSLKTFSSHQLQALLCSPHLRSFHSHQRLKMNLLPVHLCACCLCLVIFKYAFGLKRFLEKQKISR